MNCGNCKNDFTGKNFGVVVPGGVVDICSKECRAEYRKKAEAATRKKSPAGSGNAKKGVKIPRTLSKSEIKKKLRPTETDISSSIASQLDGVGAWNTRVQSGKVKTAGGGFIHLSKPGTPDRVAALGVPIWLEVKRSGEKPTDVQTATHIQLRDNGSLVFVVDDPSDMPVILNGLRTFKVEIQVIARMLREMQSSIDADLERARREGKKK